MSNSKKSIVLGTDGWMDQPTDWPMDRAGHRVLCTLPKMFWDQVEDCSWKSTMKNHNLELYQFFFKHQIHQQSENLRNCEKERHVLEMKMTFDTVSSFFCFLMRKFFFLCACYCSKLKIITAWKSWKKFFAWIWGGWARWGGWAAVLRNRRRKSKNYRWWRERERERERESERED